MQVPRTTKLILSIFIIIAVFAFAWFQNREIIKFIVYQTLKYKDFWQIVGACVLPFVLAISAWMFSWIEKDKIRLLSQPRLVLSYDDTNENINISNVGDYPIQICGIIYNNNQKNYKPFDQIDRIVLTNNNSDIARIRYVKGISGMPSYTAINQMVIFYRIFTDEKFIAIFTVKQVFGEEVFAKSISIELHTNETRRFNWLSERQCKKLSSKLVSDIKYDPNRFSPKVIQG